MLFLEGAFAQGKVTETERLPAPDGIEFLRKTVEEGAVRAEVHLVKWDPARLTLAVMDNPDGALNLRSAALKRGAMAAVNGGYFQPDRTPLGLVVWRGQELHPLERAKLLSGLVVVRGGRVSLQRVAEFKSAPAPEAALQAGPFLVDGGREVAGLDTLRVAARTVVWVDSKGGCGLLLCRSATLSDTAKILSTPGLVGPGVVHRALNLDGGSSSGLWVGGADPIYLRELKGVRNYLAVVRHPKSGVAAPAAGAR
jgi:hypothetical protein